MSKKGIGTKKTQRPTALILLVVILAATNIAGSVGPSVSSKSEEIY